MMFRRNILYGLSPCQLWYSVWATERNQLWSPRALNQLTRSAWALAPAT